MTLKNRLSVKSLLLGFVALLFIQCNESDEGVTTGGDIVITDSLPTSGVYEAVPSDLSISPALRQLTVSWKAPSGAKPAFYLVEWQGITHDQTIYTQSVNDTEVTLTGLYNTEYKVTVKAVSDRYLKSQGISATAKPIEDLEAPANVSDLKINPLASTVNFSWINPEDEDFDHIILKVREENVDTFLYEVNLLSIHDMQAFGQLKEGHTYDYSIQTFDYIGNASEPLTGTFSTKFEQLLPKVDEDNRPLWEIVDYSSQETVGDPGNAANAIDGDNGTYWHSVWYDGQFGPGVTTGKLPQFIVIDLKADYTLSGVQLYRRNGNSNGPTSAKVEATSDDPTLATAKWIDLGTTKNLGGDSNNGALTCVLNQVATARYVKITVLTSNNGYAQVREVDIKVLVDKK